MLRFYSFPIVLVLASVACSGITAERLNKQGNALAARGDWKGATAAFAAAVKASPESAKYHYNLGNGLVRLGRYAAAIDEYRIALRLDPGAEDISRALEIVSRFVASSSAQQQADLISDGLTRP